MDSKVFGPAPALGPSVMMLDEVDFGSPLLGSYAVEWLGLR